MIDYSLVSILPEITREDLLIFVFDEKIVYYKDFSKLCNNNLPKNGTAKLSRQTMTNYINDLKREKKSKKGLSPMPNTLTISFLKINMMKLKSSNINAVLLKNLGV